MKPAGQVSAARTTLENMAVTLFLFRLEVKIL